MTRRPLTSFGFFKYPSQEKEEFAQNHTTILRDEYKIEDMMVIVKRVLDWTRSIALAGFV